MPKIFIIQSCFPFFFQPHSSKFNQTKTDHLVVEPSTLNCIGLEWYISGDDNRNATAPKYNIE